MKSNLDYQVLLSRLARNAYKLHNLKKEWKVFILFVFLAKVLTWSTSIFAGYYYFSQLLFPVLQNSMFTSLTAISTLIIIEVLTTITLAKFFKFLLRGTNHISTTIALSLVVVTLFGLSFISSTNGLAMRQGTKTDKTGIIVENTNFEKKQIKNEFRDRFLNLEEQISTIKNNPQGWSRGVRSILISRQLSNIDSLQKHKAELFQEQKAELALIDQKEQSEILLNKQETTAEANKYYKIIAWVMIVQFVASGVLMFFWKRILNEDDQELIISEKIKILKDTMVSNAYHAAINEFSGVSKLIASQLMISNETYQPVTPTSRADNLIENDNRNRVQIAGFRKNGQTKSNPQESIKQDIPLIEVSGITDFNPKNLYNNTMKNPSYNGDRRTMQISNKRTCKNCGIEFDYIHWNKQYCSDTCRIENWERKTGKKLKLKKAK